MTELLEQFVEAAVARQGFCQCSLRHGWRRQQCGWYWTFGIDSATAGMAYALHNCLVCGAEVAIRDDRMDLRIVDAAQGLTVTEYPWDGGEPCLS
jgi:hypothetical protein